MIHILEKLRKPALLIAILGAVKLVTDAFGIVVLNNDNINAIANGVSAIATVVGILINRDSVEK